MILLVATGLFAEDFFSFDDTDGFGTESEAVSSVEINGSVAVPVRAYISSDAIDAIGDVESLDDTLELTPEIGLQLHYDGADFLIHTDATLAPQEDMTTEMVINEAYGQYFGENMSLEAGLMKVVWGKADEYHVVDVLNNVDLTEFLSTDYLAMMDPELMVKANIPVGMSGLFEAVYVPVLTPDRLAESGSIWEAKETKTELPAAITALATAYGCVNGGRDVTEIDLNTLDYGQAALHYTSTVEGLDYGLTYYYGFNKLPSVTVTPNIAESYIDYSLSYDRMHTFGLEAGYIAGGFNLKAEAAYNMTYDFAGDDTHVYNNNVTWVAGFDKDLPIGNLNIQETGTIILGSDGITSGDIEYDAEGEYTENLIIAALTDSFCNDRLDVKLVGFYHIEDQDYGFYPSVEYAPSDNMSATLTAHVFGGEEDTLFGQYSDNNFVECSLDWNF